MIAVLVEITTRPPPGLPLPGAQTSSSVLPNATALFPLWGAPGAGNKEGTEPQELGS